MSDKKSSGKLERNLWLWVTRPQYYLEEDGSDRESLEPNIGEIEPGSWWTCHKETRRGDLVLMWRTSPRCDVAYLIRAESDAYSLVEEDTGEEAWTYGCDYRPLYKFRYPLGLASIKKDPYLAEWNAPNSRFQRSFFRFERRHWDHIIERLAELNPDFVSAYRAEGESQLPEFPTERKIEDHICSRLDLLKPFGFNLGLWSDSETRKNGRQYQCPGVGRIDLLCFDTITKEFVVIEIKNVKADRNVFGQVYSYVGWVAQNICRPKGKVRGLVISRGADETFLSCIRANNQIEFVDLNRLGLGPT